VLPLASFCAWPAYVLRASSGVREKVAWEDKYAGDALMADTERREIIDCMMGVGRKFCVFLNWKCEVC